MVEYNVMSFSSDTRQILIIYILKYTISGSEWKTERIYQMKLEQL